MSLTDLFGETADVVPEGVSLQRSVFSMEEISRQFRMIAEVLALSPPFRPCMRNGTPFGHDISNCGALGWVSDTRGYRYSRRHPETGVSWSPIPAGLRDAAVAAAARAGVADFVPDACLINLYGPKGRMGLHQDRDEADLTLPIVSFSLGADAVFALGGLDRRDPVTRFTLRSGDVLVLHGPSRLRFHGVDRLRPAAGPRHAILPEGGRINLTFRRAG